MKTKASTLNDDYDNPLITNEEDEEAHEDDLWFLPGPLEEEPDDLPPGPRAEPPDTAVVHDWAKAEGFHAARLARVAGRWVLWMTGCCVARKAGDIASLLSRQRTLAGSQGIG